MMKPLTSIFTIIRWQSPRQQHLIYTQTEDRDIYSIDTLQVHILLCPYPRRPPLPSEESQNRSRRYPESRWSKHKLQRSHLKRSIIYNCLLLLLEKIVRALSCDEPRDEARQMRRAMDIRLTNRFARQAGAADAIIYFLSVPYIAQSYYIPCYSYTVSVHIVLVSSLTYNN